MVHRRHFPRGSFALALALGLATLTAPAAADDAGGEGDAAVRYAARFVAERGASALERNELDEALRLFNVAEQLFHAPTLVLAIAQTEARLGRWAEAHRHYQAVIDEALPPRSPPAFRKAQATARDELAALEPRIPRITLEVVGHDGPVQVRVDGKPVPNETIEAGMLVSPGRHDVVVVAGDEVRVAEVKVAPKERKAVTIDFSEPLAGGSATRTTGGDAVVDWWWPATAYGLGVAGFAVGAATGIMALDDASALRDQCQPGTTACPPAARSLEDSARTLGTVSTIGFVVGGVGVVTGTVLLLVDRVSLGSDDVALEVGPGSLGLRGRF